MRVVVAVLEMDEQPASQCVADKVLGHHALLHVPRVDGGRQAEHGRVVRSEKELAPDQEEVVGGVGAEVESGVGQVDGGHRVLRKMDAPPAECVGELGLGGIELARPAEDAVDAGDADPSAFEAHEAGPGRIELGALNGVLRGPSAELQDVRDEGGDGLWCGLGGGKGRRLEDGRPGTGHADLRPGRSGVEAAVVSAIGITAGEQHKRQPQWCGAEAQPAETGVDEQWHERCKNVRPPAGSLGFGMHFATGRTFVNPHSPCPFTRHRLFFSPSPDA